MILESFKDWKRFHLKDQKWEDEEDMFSVFFVRHTLGKTRSQILGDLAFQIMHLQECVDGILDDMESL